MDLYHFTRPITRPTQIKNAQLSNSQAFYF